MWFPGAVGIQKKNYFKNTVTVSVSTYYWAYGHIIKYLGRKEWLEFPQGIPEYSFTVIPTNCLTKGCLTLTITKDFGNARFWAMGWEMKIAFFVCFIVTS